MKKAVFFDIDGTLVGHKFNMNEIPQEVISQMDRLRTLDYALFIATGRPIALIPGEISDYPFDGMILCNGAHVMIDGKTVHCQPVNASHMQEAIEQLDSLDVEYIYHTTDKLYTKKTFSKIYETYLGFGMKEKDVVFDFDTSEVAKKALKVETLFDERNFDTVTKLLEDKFQYDNFGAFNCAEFYSKDSSKAKGIQKVLEYLHVDVENSYAYGDGTNDIDMIKYVGHGIAMENAAQELKDVANEICGHVAHGGLAKALEKLN